MAGSKVIRIKEDQEIKIGKNKTQNKIAELRSQI